MRCSCAFSFLVIGLCSVLAATLTLICPTIVLFMCAQPRFQLELTLWDKHSPEEDFVGEVLLNVAKLQQVLGKYFEHSFPVKTSSVYNSRSRIIDGSVRLGLQLNGPN